MSDYATTIQPYIDKIATELYPHVQAIIAAGKWPHYETSLKQDPDTGNYILTMKVRPGEPPLAVDED